MARYASGKYAYGISDRSGFRYRLADMITEWNGLKVGPDEYEPKHPQLEPISPGSDPQALFEPRPDTSTEVAGQRLLIINPFQSSASGTAVVTVFEPSHGRSTSDVVVFRKVEAFDGFTEATLEKTTGYSITVVNEDSYTIIITNGESATIGNTRGGGNNATAGPGTASSPPTTASTFDATNVTLDSTSKTFDEG
tara:strand:+ start:28 stop:612 length:585 start_codon:yes stop_codon:yes gene_type:complete